MLGSFLQGLAEDYQLWANDSKYRQQQRRRGDSGDKSELVVTADKEEEIIPPFPSLTTVFFDRK